MQSVIDVMVRSTTRKAWLFVASDLGLDIGRLQHDIIPGNDNARGERFGVGQRHSPGAQYLSSRRQQRLLPQWLRHQGRGEDRDQWRGPERLGTGHTRRTPFLPEVRSPTFMIRTSSSPMATTPSPSRPAAPASRGRVSPHRTPSLRDGGPTALCTGRSRAELAPGASLCRPSRMRAVPVRRSR